MSDSLSPKERLIRSLNKQKVDRNAVICPGGMMNAAIVDVMNSTGHKLPEAHMDTELMALLANDVHEQTGFENFGIPFCMTVEAEVLGSDINYGTLECEPKIQKENYPSVSKVDFKPLGSMSKNSRVNSIIQAGYNLSKKYPDIPMIGNLTGPISTSASIVDPMRFLKELRKDKENAHKVISYVADHLIELATLMVENGADVISMADPTATGEILGPRMFEEYAVPYINKVVDAIHKLGVPAIVHICGNMNVVKNSVIKIRSNAISTDAFVSLKVLKDEFPDLTTMGNLSTIALEFSNQDAIAKQTQKLVDDGINIISPACGLSTSTPIKNLQTMTDVVRSGY